MSAAETSVLGALALGLAAPLAWIALRRVPRSWSVENHRGKRIAPALGLAWFASVRIAELGQLLLGLPPRSSGRTLWLAADLAVLVLVVVGLIDDRRGGPKRGFGPHVGSILRLRPSTGAMKLLAGGGLAIWLAVLIGGGAVHVAASAILIALATNLVNALDVRPGRALKWSLPVVAIAWVLLIGEPLAILMVTALGAGLGVLPFDLAESGMLGDAGSNPLGFLSGVGLAAVLPTCGVVIAAVVAVLLQVAAETVTISRLIEAVPPLRWFDELGRAKDPVER